MIYIIKYLISSNCDKKTCSYAYNTGSDAIKCKQTHIVCHAIPARYANKCKQSNIVLAYNTGKRCRQL